MGSVVKYVVDSYKEVVNNVDWTSRVELQKKVLTTGFYCVLISLLILFIDTTVRYFIDFIFSLG